MQLQYGEHRITVAAEALAIGSDAAAAIRLAGASVAPRHAVVRRSGSTAILEPTGGGAIAINGTPIGRDPTPLFHGDRIAIAGHEILVLDESTEGQATQVLEAPAARQRSEAPPAASRLVNLSDGREYQVNVAPFVFGREATSAVVITSPDSSRRHAEIVNRPDGDVLVDLSSNGTFVNGTRVSGRHELKALDVIRIGAEEFRYYPAPSRPEPPVAPEGAAFRLGDTLVGLPQLSMPQGTGRPAAERAAPTPLASLLVKKGQLKGDRVSITTPVVNLGRAEYNDVRLPDPSISASHAKLQLREGVWMIADTGSTNGTLVDDIPVSDETPLSPGSVIGLGEVRLLFEPRDKGGAKAAGTQVLRPPAPEPRVVGPSDSETPARRLWPAIVVVVLLAIVAAVALLS
ncbi:MAG: FHA domain-containing protein [Gemmatimonadales bacterium]